MKLAPKSEQADNETQLTPKNTAGKTAGATWRSMPTPIARRESLCHFHIYHALGLRRDWMASTRKSAMEHNDNQYPRGCKWNGPRTRRDEEQTRGREERKLGGSMLGIAVMCKRANGISDDLIQHPTDRVWQLRRLVSQAMNGQGRVPSNRYSSPGIRRANCGLQVHPKPM